MSNPDRYPKWLRRWRRRRAWQQNRREFVYLDEVSVTSLVAAREGAVAESYKDTLSATTTAEAGTTLGLSAPAGGSTVGWSSKVTSGQTTAQEVVRRAVIQGTFRNLRIGDTDLKLSVEDQPARTRPKAVETTSGLVDCIAKLEKQRRAVRVCDLDRGDVLEVRVDLDAEKTYQITAAVTSILDLLKERAAMFGLAESQLTEGEVIAELLRRLLVDLIPITAQVTSHRRVVIDGEPWLVDASMIKDPSPLADEASIVTLAGVTELPLFWKDVRRILFDGSSYTVYARLSKPGLHDSWSPVKLADVFERIFPDVGAHMRALPVVLGATTAGRTVPEPPPPAETLLTRGLIPFGLQLAELTERSIDEAALAGVAARAAQRIASTEDLADVGIVRAAFAEVTDFVAGDQAVGRELVRSLREAHQTIARLQVALESVQHAATDPVQGHTPAHLLEVEFIAIYW
ncbi:hypothetical protein ACIA03_10055 [Nocardioides sp. NPDC051685]|uniref:DUF6414 family protein n=1 Tax=Nocardioides sp. NPDC051685 TaxID=3364334 RepID=UPI0037B10421